MKEVVNNTWSTGSPSADIVIILMIITAVIILWVAILMLKVIKFYVEESANPVPFSTAEEKEIKRLQLEAQKALEKKSPSIWSKIMQLKPIEEEENMVMEHKFDGISELNNPTPAWFMVLFYGTILFAIGYMLNYHVFNYGKLQDEEYVIEMQKAAEDKAAFLASPANAASAINENNIVLNTDPEVLKAGMALYATRCPPCHGEQGQGLVGPNLTDEYSLHGSSIQDVFKTIKYGVPEKGMIAWEKSMSAQQLSDITNYLMSIKGSNPADPKAPQGNKD